MLGRVICIIGDNTGDLVGVMVILGDTRWCGDRGDVSCGDETVGVRRGDVNVIGNGCGAKM